MRTIYKAVNSLGNEVLYGIRRWIAASFDGLLIIGMFAGTVFFLVGFLVSVFLEG